jgi:hypothetical protein
MKDKRIWEFKRRAEEDNLITAGACRLILRIASWRYCTKHHPADSEFSLSWRSMAAWYDNDGPERVKRKETIYGWMRELVMARYLHYNGRKGCPAQACYRLDLDHKPERLTLFDWAAERGDQVVKKSLVRDAGSGVAVGGKNRQLEAGKNRQLDGEKKQPLEDGKNRQPVGGKNRAPINRYSLREEMIRPKGRNGGAARRQLRKNDLAGSLRSSEGEAGLTHGSGKVASTVPAKKESPSEDRATLRSDLSADGRAGGSSPPGRERKLPPSPAGLTREQRHSVSLHTAKLCLETGAHHHLGIDHVAALVREGIEVPPDVLRKFPALKVGKRKRALEEVLL